MHRRVHELLARQALDAIHADQLWMAQYALAAREANGANGRPKLVLDQHNAVHLIHGRLASGNSNPVTRAFLRLESRVLAHYELETCRQFDCVVWVTREDRASFARMENGLVPSRAQSFISSLTKAMAMLDDFSCRRCLRF